MAVGGFGGSSDCHTGAGSTFWPASCDGVIAMAGGRGRSGSAPSSVATVRDTGTSPPSATTNVLSPTASGTVTNWPPTDGWPATTGPAPPCATGGGPRSGPDGNVLS